MEAVAGAAYSNEVEAYSREVEACLTEVEPELSQRCPAVAAVVSKQRSLVAVVEPMKKLLGEQVVAVAVL